MGKTLVFAVFDFDRFTKNDEIGEVKFAHFIIIMKLYLVIFCVVGPCTCL